MTGTERNELREIQDTWLALREVRLQIKGWGWNHPIATPGSPTFANVRDMLHPAWRGWFCNFIGDATE